MKKKILKNFLFVLVLSSTVFVSCSFSMDGDCSAPTNPTGNGDSSTEDSQIETYSVSFYDGEELLATQHVADGDCAEVSVAPEKNGYIFKGWYDAEGLFDFTTPITSNVILTTKYVSKTLPVKNSFTAQELSEYAGMRGKFEFAVDWGSGGKARGRLYYGGKLMASGEWSSSSHALIKFETEVIEVNAKYGLYIYFDYYNENLREWKTTNFKTVKKVTFIPE